MTIDILAILFFICSSVAGILLSMAIVDRLDPYRQREVERSNKLHPVAPPMKQPVREKIKGALPGRIHGFDIQTPKPVVPNNEIRKPRVATLRVKTVAQKRREEELRKLPDLAKLTVQEHAERYIATQQTHGSNSD